ncbi:TetR/AcrR family transcriptional regulator [Amycolatopsis sp. 195334CR]|uniref:TetR/AcrR family transcriptional regulator n=1 Tax=Amycolatopsis sp. 195334CR TaxID=2814588 RepID=UPI001A8D5C47|nr:TetR/AcrR family transcriptional regulator [Amycolatopsis sp. 195334CR]MBN6040400.1 TetR/AcrR family transcriptional regulator [Amycolatopsis sp. 195334CR]
MPASKNPPTRRDAHRNRERLLESARHAFAERGAQAALDGIAREAGLVTGTLYRHFPTRLDLLWAVLEPKLHRLLDEVRALPELEDPWEAFRSLLEVLCSAQAEDRAFGDFLAKRFPGDDRTEAVHGEICALAQRVLERAQEAGAVRSDVTGADLFLLFWASGRVAEATRHVAPSMWRRHVYLALDGFRASNRLDLQEPAWDADQLHRAMAVPGKHGAELPELR